MFRKVTGADANGSAIESADTSDWGVTWSQETGISAKQNRVSQCRRKCDCSELRDDRLLAETDWMGNSDVTMSSDWTTYRQALRDLPSGATPTLNSDGTLNMSSVTFPTKPS